MYRSDHIFSANPPVCCCERSSHPTWVRVSAWALFCGAQETRVRSSCSAGLREATSSSSRLPGIVCISSSCRKSLCGWGGSCGWPVLFSDHLEDVLLPSGLHGFRRKSPVIRTFDLSYVWFLVSPPCDYFPELVLTSAAQQFGYES